MNFVKVINSYLSFCIFYDNVSAIRCVENRLKNDFVTKIKLKAIRKTSKTSTLFRAVVYA